MINIIFNLKGKTPGSRKRDLRVGNKKNNMAKKINPTGITKRYLVTYSDGSVGMQKASSILNVKASAMRNAEEIMATDAILTADDVVHFEGMGISSLEMTHEEAKKVGADPRVVAVEEDLEMFALDADFATSYTESETRAYQNGYTDAMYGLFKKLFAPPTAPGAEGTGLRVPLTVEPMANQPIPFNINQVKAPAAWARGFRGTGIKVAVLDTGVSAHSDLVISGGISFVSGVASFNDGHGHGTHCCGVVGARNNSIGVVGVAPECSLYAVKVLSDAGSGSSSWIIAGMTWAKNNGMKVISMSLGSSSAPSAAYTAAIAQCNAAGVTVVCASGNAFGSAFPWVGAPANSPGAVAVGAVDSNNIIASFSSRGIQGSPATWNPVSLVAPGVNVRSTYKGNTYTTMSGTSMATPHVAGAAVLVKQRFPAFTPAQVKAKLQSSASDLGPAGVDATYGAGLLNCDKATL
jgi:subtilisin